MSQAKVDRYKVIKKKKRTEKNHGKRKKNPYLCFLQSAVPHLAHAEFGTGIKICNIKI